MGLNRHPEIELKLPQGRDPTFVLGSTHTAHITVRNLGAQDLTCTIEFYMLDPYNPTWKVNRVYTTPTIKAGKTFAADPPITMALTYGIWWVFIDVWEYPPFMTNLIKSFQFEDINLV